MATIAPAARRLSGLGLCLERPEPRRSDGGVLAEATAAATAAERLGFTSVWVTETSAESPGRVPYEAFSLLGALAVPTGAIRLGAVAEPDQRRAPSILAKIVTSIDVISHGRAVLSLDGDRSTPADAERLVEALEVARAVLEDEHPTVEGRIYSVEDAVNRPAPVQSGGVPLVVFVRPGHGEDVLEACARSADAVVACGGVDAVEDVVSFVERWVGDRVRPGDRVAVLGQLTGWPSSDGWPPMTRDHRTRSYPRCATPAPTDAWSACRHRGRTKESPAWPSAGDAHSRADAPGQASAGCMTTLSGWIT